MKSYRLTDASSVLSPCLLVYPQIVRSNIDAMIQIAGSPERLRPHVKTHKCSTIVRQEVERGILKHKCATLAEAEMLAQVAPDVLIAYPQVGPNIARLAALVASAPQTRFSVVVDSMAALQDLEACFQARGLQLDVLIDVDTGMHRTGIAPQQAAVGLGQMIAASKPLQFAGLHIYDGQNHQPVEADRIQAVDELMQPVVQLMQQLQAAGLEIPKVVMGGTPTFPIFARYQFDAAAFAKPVAIELSPGTTVLSDFNYGRDYRDLSAIQHAATLLTRVVSKPLSGHVTVDLGYKAIASDQPFGKRCHFLDLPDAVEVGHSEEHLVIRTSHADDLPIGHELYVVPAHICPTVALHETMQVVDDGVVIGEWQVDARNRLYH